MPGRVLVSSRLCFYVVKLGLTFRGPVNNCNPPEAFSRRRDAGQFGWHILCKRDSGSSSRAIERGTPDVPKQGHLLSRNQPSSIAIGYADSDGKGKYVDTLTVGHEMVKEKDRRLQWN
ncbi:Pyrrolocin cluster transcription factor fsdR [Fusarium oxysporum f. sp. albedinis]|nr:Pyrrolocin cluster transcription factor fsdR [Fusarium oxysporum f. sp. albedinis]